MLNRLEPAKTVGSPNDKLMPRSAPRLVVDTNTVLRGLAKPNSTSGRTLASIENGDALLLTSKRVIEEYRLILFDPNILSRFPQLNPRAIEAALRRLIYLSASFGTVRTRFEFPRDPKDEKFLALAIAGGATHLVTFDEDLLSLPNSHTDAAKRLRQRLPGLQIKLPADFLRNQE